MLYLKKKKSALALYLTEEQWPWSWGNNRVFLAENVKTLCSILMKANYYYRRWTSEWAKKKKKKCVGKCHRWQKITKCCTSWSPSCQWLPVVTIIVCCIPSRGPHTQMAAFAQPHKCLLPCTRKTFSCPSLLRFFSDNASEQPAIITSTQRYHSCYCGGLGEECK